MLATLADMRQIFSVGHLAANLQTSVATVREIASRLAILADCEINGVLYFDGEAAEQIRREIGRRQQRNDQKVE